MKALGPINGNEISISITIDEISTLQAAMQMMNHAMAVMPIIVGTSDAQQRIDARNMVDSMLAELNRICVTNKIPMIDMSQGGF